MRSRPHPSAPLLRKLYLDMKLSTNELARVFGVENSTIHDWMKEQGIPRRSYVNAAKEYILKIGHDRYRQTMRDRTTKYHESTRATYPPRKLDVDDVVALVALREQGNSWQKIVDQLNLNVDRATVRDYYLKVKSGYYTIEGDKLVRHPLEAEE